MLVLQDVSDWLKVFLIADGYEPVDFPAEPVTNNGVTIIWGGYTPSKPDRLIQLTPTGGARNTYERLFETNTLQIATRGRADDADDAEALTKAVDAAFLGTACPTTIGQRHVIDMDYVGGPPRFFDRDKGRRTRYVSNIFIQLAR